MKPGNRREMDEFHKKWQKPEYSFTKTDEEISKMSFKKLRSDRNKYTDWLGDLCGDFAARYLIHKDMRKSFRMTLVPPPQPPPGIHLPKGVWIPDYRTFKVEDCPPLLETQQKLAARGLKDPWLRTWVWAYHPDMIGTKKGRWITTVARGWKTGVILLAITWVLERIYGPYQSKNPYSEHDNGHSGHH